MLLAARPRFPQATTSTRPTQLNTSFFTKMQPVRMFATPPPPGSDNFLSGANANYVDYMYAQW